MIPAPDGLTCRIALACDELGVWHAAGDSSEPWEACVRLAQSACEGSMVHVHAVEVTVPRPGVVEGRVAG